MIVRPGIEAILICAKVLQGFSTFVFIVQMCAQLSNKAFSDIC